MMVRKTLGPYLENRFSQSIELEYIRNHSILPRLLANSTNNEGNDKRSS